MRDLFAPPPEPVVDVAQRPHGGFCIFDTETSGLPLRGKGHRPDAPGQPHVAAIGMIWTTPGLAVTREEVIFVKRNGWKMDPGATAVNGITDEFLDQNGVDISEVVDLFEETIQGGWIMSAFNIKFDMAMMTGEFMRLGRIPPNLRVPTVCSMMKSTGVVRARTATGASKTPRLAEAMRHFYLPQMGHHTPGGDANSALLVTRKLQQIGIDLSPTLWHMGMAEDA